MGFHRSANVSFIIMYIQRMFPTSLKGINKVLKFFFLDFWYKSCTYDAKISCLNFRIPIDRDAAVVSGDSVYSTIGSPCLLPSHARNNFFEGEGEAIGLVYDTGLLSVVIPYTIHCRRYPGVFTGLCEVYWPTSLQDFVLMDLPWE